LVLRMFLKEVSIESFLFSIITPPKIKEDTKKKKKKKKVLEYLKQEIYFLLLFISEPSHRKHILTKSFMKF